MFINYIGPDSGRQHAKRENAAVPRDSELASASPSVTPKTRQRKWTPRVRTGCVSCRQRRVKCDERKPACDNCTSKGRACQGYEAWLVSWQPNPAVVQQPSPVKTPFPTIPEARERQLFFLFRQHFVADVSPVFPSDFWKRGSLLACQEYPAAWHAALAIGAAYRSEQKDISGAVAAQDWKEDEVSALKHCNKAMRHLSELRHRDASLTFAQQEMVLVTCMLLNRYCSLRRQDADALVHAKNGIKLLGQWGYWQRAEKTSPNRCLPDCVAPLGSMFVPFMRLEMELFGTAFRPPIEPSLAAAASGKISVGHDSRFVTVQDAYEEILAIALSHRRYYESIAQSSADEAHAWHRESNRFHNNLFQSWQHKFRALQLRLRITADDKFGHKSSADPLDIIAALVLKIYEQSMGNILRLDTSEGSFVLEDFPDHFREIVHLSEEIFRMLPRTRARRPRIGGGRSWMAMVPMLCEPLQVASLVCRDAPVRDAALALLEVHPYRSECYDSALFVPVARAKAAIERAGWCEDPIEGGCACDPEKEGVVCEVHRVTQITPAEGWGSEEGRATLIIVTGLDALRGLPGRPYTVPYARGTSVAKFRWRGFPWGKAASKAV